MKTLTNFLELTIIVCVAVIIILPEIAYSLILRARDKVEMIMKEVI